MSSLRQCFGAHCGRQCCKLRPLAPVPTRLGSRGSGPQRRSNPAHSNHHHTLELAGRFVHLIKLKAKTFRETVVVHSYCRNELLRCLNRKCGEPHEPDVPLPLSKRRKDCEEPVENLQ